MKSILFLLNGPYKEGRLHKRKKTFRAKSFALFCIFFTSDYFDTDYCGLRSMIPKYFLSNVLTFLQKY